MLNQNNNLSFIYQELEAFGLIVDEIDTSRTGIVRCPTIAKPHKKNGAYVYFPENNVCWCKDWQTGEEKTIVEKGSNLSKRDIAKINELRLIKYNDIEELQKEIAEKAKRIWGESLQVKSTPYTYKKGIKCYSVKKYHNSLVVPVCDEMGTIWSLQFINADGSKNFLKGGKKKGCFLEIKGNEKIVLCEGYATGASIHEATGYTVIVCFDGNNLREVAKKFDSCIIAADNDLNNEGENHAKKTDKQYFLPPLIDGKSTDFNDLHKTQGLEAVKRCFDSPIQKEKEISLDAGKNTKIRPKFVEVTIDNRGVHEKVNRPYLAQHIRENEDFLLVQDGIGSIMVYWYANGVYVHISSDRFKSIIKKYITDYDIGLLKMPDIDEVCRDLMTDGDYCPDSQLNSNRDIINFQNGILNLQTRQLEPHSPEIFSTIQIPCNYNKDNKNSPIFDAFMKEFTSGDIEKNKFYLQWIGVVISNVPAYIFKKALLVIGDPHSGKSVYLDFLLHSLGKDNYASIDLGYLEKSNFALSTLHRKRLGFCGDMSFIKVDELKNFKSLTGGDAIKIEYKGQKAFSTTYNGALMFNSNGYPKFGGDTGKAVFDRFIVLSANNVLPESQRDNLLRKKLFAENEAIISCAIDELYNVIDNGYKFNIPSEHLKMIDIYKAENSHAVEFYKEYCIDRPVDIYKKLKPIHDSINQALIYAVFREWSIQRYGNSYVTSKANFEKELASYLGVETISKKTNGGKLYYSFIINSDACKEFDIECITPSVVREIALLKTDFVYEKENPQDFSLL